MTMQYQVHGFDEYFQYKSGNLQQEYLQTHVSRVYFEIAMNMKD